MYKRQKPHWVLKQVQRRVADCLMSSNKRASELKIACLGLAFKPDIDDLRESPAVQVTKLIADWHQGSTLVVEPNVQQLPAKLQQSVTLVALNDALQQADVLVLLVDHRQFKAIDPASVNQPWVVDTKGVWR